MAPGMALIIWLYNGTSLSSLTSFIKFVFSKLWLPSGYLNAWDVPLGMVCERMPHLQDTILRCIARSVSATKEGVCTNASSILLKSKIKNKGAGT